MLCFVVCETDIGSQHRSIVGLFCCSHVAAVLTIVSNDEGSAGLELRLMHVVATLTIFAALFVIFLKQLPGAVDSDVSLSQHVDKSRGIHLQFCEPPFQFFQAVTMGAAQGASFICHLPFIPAAVFVFRRVLVYGSTGLQTIPSNELSRDAIALIGLQVALQLWTGFGHYVPDPRMYHVTELSIIVSVSWLMVAIKCTTPHDVSESAAGSQKFASLVLAITSMSGLIFYFFGLLTFIVLAKVGLPVVAAIFSSDLGLCKLASPKERAIAMSLLITTSFVIIVEGSFCNALLGRAELPYHAFFDFLFFQVTSTFILSVACRSDATKHNEALREHNRLKAQ
jgi:hypothetical protein